MKQDTAAAVCDRIVFDLTVAVVKSDNTFFHNIIEGIVIDLDILMVSTQKKCMAANATDDILKFTSGDLNVFHCCAILNDTRKCGFFTWSIKLKGFLVDVSVCHTGFPSVIFESAVFYIEAIDRTNLHLMHTAAARQGDTGQIHICCMKETDHTGSILTVSDQRSAIDRYIFKSIISGAEITFVVVCLVFVGAGSTGYDHVEFTIVCTGQCNTFQI